MHNLHSFVYKPFLKEKTMPEDIENMTFEEQVLLLLTQMLNAQNVLAKALVLAIEKKENDNVDTDPDGLWW